MPSHIRRTALTIAALILIGLYCTSAIAYMLKPGYLNQGEPPITILAERVLRATAVYHRPDAPQRFVLPYGPAIFLGNALFISWGDDPILASKCAGVAFSLAGLLLSWIAFQRSFGRQVATFAIALAILSYMCFKNYSYWPRPESLMLFSCGLALVSITSPRPLVSFIGLSIAIGIMGNTKLFAPAYLAPIIVLYGFGAGWKWACASCALALLWLALPFASSTVFHLPTYIYWLSAMGQQPIPLSNSISNMGFASLFCGPSLGLLLVLSYTQRSKALLCITAAAFAMIGIICIIGAKVGAGSYYLLPTPLLLFYVAIYAALRLSKPRLARPSSPQIKRALTFGLSMWLAALVALAVNGQRDVISFLRDTQGQAIAQDLRAIRLRFAHSTVQMGYGDDNGYRATFFRPLLYADGSEYILDAPSMWDMYTSKSALPQELLEVFISEQVDIWLVPRGDQPFSMRANSGSPEQLFGHTFQQAFLGHYRRVANSQFYDIWLANRLELQDIAVLSDL